ncbi:Vacuolar protein sorting-associated protein 8-like protein, partial [Dichanthelium oligosanthes]
MPSASASSSPAMASQHPPPRQELDLDAFLPSSPTSSTASDADHRRAVDDLLLLLSSSDSDSEDSTPVPSTSSRALYRVQAPAPPAEPSPLRSPSASASPSPSPSPRRSTSAAPSETISPLVARTFSSNGASSSSSKPLPSLFRGVRPSPKPGAALAAAAAASRAVLTPHAAAIKSRRSLSAPVEKLLDEGSGSEVSEELPSTGSLGAEVEEKGNSEVVAEPTEQAASGSGSDELEEEKHGEVEIEERSEPTKLVEASTLNSVDAEDFSGHEETAEDGNVVGTDQVRNQIGAVDEENAYDQTGDGDYMQSDPIESVSEESFDDDRQVERSGSSIEDQVESESLIDKVIEERMEQLEISRKAEKNAEKKLKVSMKPLEWAEELEKRQASFGQHWEEGAAAQPMQLEGIGKGPPAIGYMQIEMDNPVTRAMSSPSFRQDHGSPQVLAVHRSYITMGTSKGVVIVIPSKYSIHQADDTDAKMLFFWNQSEKTQSPVTAMCFNQQGDLLLVGYGDGHMTIWDVQKATAAKVVYGEHAAPVVHVCFIRQSKAITGDSKGVVLLHTFSIIPVINRLTIKGTQRLFDGNNGIVLSACPLLVDESFGFSNLSAQGNQTTSSSGGLGSMMGGVVGGVVGVDSGWKFFNESSSTVEDGVVVMFIMHQHALVVRLRTNIDHVDHIETFSRPDGAREGSIAYTAWKYTSSLNDSSSLDEERVSWLALAWDRQVQVAKFVKSKMVKHKEWKLDSAAVGVAWLDDQMLVVLNLRGQLCLFSKDGSELRRTTFVPDGLLFDDTILHHAHFSNKFGNPERHFNSSVAVRGATVYILGPTFLTVSRLLPWKERIEALKRAGDWMGALDMAMRLYDGQTQGVVDLPRTVDSIREAIMPYLVELLLSYISYVFEYISIALSNHTGKGGESDVLIEADRSLLTQREEQYARVGGVAVEFCVHIGRNDILFDTVFSKFVAAQSGGIFLEVLEPYILKDMLGSLPPEIMQALVEHYSGKGWLQRVEQCILHMDISSLDFNQVVRLCREHGLYGALIYLFNQGLNDFRTPLEELLSVVQNSNGKDAASTGYRMLVYLKYCFQGLAFPPGHGIIPRSRLHSVREELLQFLLEESKSLTSEIFKGFNASCGKCPNICYPLWMDTEATLEVLRCAFAQDSFEPRDEPSSIVNASVSEDEDGIDAGSPESQNNMVQNVLDAIIDIVGLEKEVIRSIVMGTADSEFWPSEKEFGYLIEFVSFFVSHKRAIASKRVVMHILTYLTSSYDDAITRTQKEKEVLQLFNVVPRNDWNSDFVLNLCLDAHFHQACGLIFTARNQNLAALDSYMKDKEEPFHAFIFIDKRLLELSDDEALSFRTTVISRFPELVKLSRECAFILVIDHFCDEIQQILAELHSDRHSLFLFLKTAIEVHLSGKLDLSELSLRNNQTVELKYFSADLEDYRQRLSNLSKLDHDPVSIDDELVELYLELLCQYERRSVLKFLETFDSYRLERCLHLCLDYGVTDAAAFLQERVGDVGSALALILVGLDDKISLFISSVENTFSGVASKSISETKQPDIVLEMSEAHPVLDALHAAIGLCQRNSQRLDPEESQSLWFQLLDSFSEPLKKLYVSKDVNEKSTRSKGSEAPIEHLKGKELSQQMRISAKQRCLNVLRKIFSQFVGEIIEAMAGYIPLPVIMAKLLSDNGSQEFGDFKLVIHRMLSMYLYEKRILETAKSVIEDDSFYTLSLLKRGVCHGFAPQTFVCCICNCSLSKEGAISAVRLFSCGHATHLQCESEQNRSSNRESKDGCPVCLSMSNTQARNKSPMFENGLLKYSGAEHEVSHGIHQIHEVDHAERSRGLQHLSRYEILNNLQKEQKSFHIETVPPLKLAPPAIYHEKIQKRTTLVGEPSKHSVRSQKPQKIWQMKEQKSKQAGNRLLQKSSVLR